MPDEQQQDWRDGAEIAQAVDAELTHWLRFFEGLQALKAAIGERALTAIAALTPLQRHIDQLEGQIRKAQEEMTRLQAAVVAQREKTTTEVEKLAQELRQKRQAYAQELETMGQEHGKALQAMRREEADALRQWEAKQHTLAEECQAKEQAHARTMAQWQQTEAAVKQRVQQAEARLNELAQLVRRGGGAV